MGRGVRGGAVDPVGLFTLRSKIFTLIDNLTFDDETNIQFIVQFSDDGGSTWYDYKQGLFASLFYEDQDTAAGITECFRGRVIRSFSSPGAAAEDLTFDGRSIWHTDADADLIYQLAVI